MKLNTLALVLASALVPVSAFAQDPPATEPAAVVDSGSGNPLSFGADLAIVLPFGDWADIAGVGIGVLVRGQYAVSEKVSATARIGYIHHLAKDVGGVDVSTAEIPILIGARYILVPNVWVGAETGINMWKWSVGDMSETNTRIPLTFGAGYNMDKLQFGAGLFIPNLLLTETGEDTQMGLMLNVGYTFM